jgi:acyl-CoA thioester hydrolase
MTMVDKVLKAFVEIEIPFHDVDSVQIVWHGNYAKYFEIARSALLRTFNYDIPDMAKSGYGWPVVDLQVKFIKPLKYGEKIKVVATLIEYENRLKITYEVIRQSDNSITTKGHTTQIAVNMVSGETLFATPETLISKVLAALN